MISSSRAAPLLLVAVAALAACHSRSGAPDAAAAAANRVVPVRTAPVTLKDVPITLEGLGTAVGYYTVMVRSQVDGRLDKVGFKEGQAVKKGDLLAEVDPRPFEIQLHQAQAAQARDEATLHNAELSLTRDEELFSRKLIAQSDVDNQRTTRDQAKAAVQADLAQEESAKLNLDYARIKSPIDGITGVRQVDPGNLVHASDATGIVVITQLDPISVLFTLPEDVLPEVSKAMASGPLQVEALSRDGSTSLGTGVLELVDNQINTATATIKLKARFDNPQHLLWPNQFVKARLQLEVQRGARTIPAVAVQSGPQGSFVYVVQPNQTVDTAPVKVQLLQGDLAILADGPQPGAQVVIDGQNQLKPGAKVSTQAESNAGAGASAGSHRGGADGGRGGFHQGRAAGSP